jgi:hypothetical protein
MKLIVLLGLLPLVAQAYGPLSPFYLSSKEKEQDKPLEVVFDKKSGEPKVRVRSERVRACPMHHPEHDKIINNLSKLKAELSDVEKCRPIAEKIADLEGIVNSGSHAFFKDIILRVKGGDIDNDQQEELSVEDIENIQNHANTITSSALSLVNSLSGSDDQCVNENKGTGILNAVASVTQEATGFIAGLAGPYNVPVSIAGNALGGIISGIDSFFTKRKKGFDFDEAEQRKLFGKSFCIYNEMLYEVDYMSNPDDTIAALEKLSGYLKGKKEKIYEGCSNCVDYSNGYLAYHKKKEDSAKVLKSLSIVTEETDPWARCIAISEEVHDPGHTIDGLLQTVGSLEVETPEEERLRKKFTDEVDFARGEIVPNGLRCNAQADEKKVKSANKRYLSTLKTLRGYAFEFLNARLKRIRDKADETYNSPLGSYTKKSIEVDMWTGKEILRIKDTLGRGVNSAIFEILELRGDLDLRIFDILTPKFLEWHLKGAKENFSDYKDDLKKYFSKKKKELEKKLGKKKVDHIEDMRGLTTFLRYRGLSHGVDFAPFAGEMNKLAIMVRKTLYGLLTIRDYCDFVGPTGSATDKIWGVCSSSELSRMIREVSLELGTIEPKEGEEDGIGSAEAMIEFVSWLKKSHGISSDWIFELTKTVEKWNKRTDIFDLKKEGSQSAKVTK